MPAPVIVIEIAAQQPAPEHLPTLIEACNRAASGAECVLEPEPETVPEAVAIVHWEDRDRVRIEVGVRKTEGSDWRVRDFTFLPGDEFEERWRAVGFAIGTLASSERKRIEEEASTPPEKKPPEVPPPKPPARKPRRPKPVLVPRRSTESVWMDIGGMVGPGLESGAFRFGPLVRAAWAPASSRIFLTLSLVAAFENDRRADADVTSLWFDAGGGLGLRIVALPRVHAEVEVEAVGQRFSVSASDSVGRSDAASRWLLGARSGLSGAVMFSRDIGAYVALNGTWFAGQTEVRLQGTTFGSAPEFGYWASVGLRLRLR